MASTSVLSKRMCGMDCDCVRGLMEARPAICDDDDDDDDDGDDDGDGGGGDDDDDDDGHGRLIPGGQQIPLSWLVTCLVQGSLSKLYSNRPHVHREARLGAKNKQRVNARQEMLES